MSERKFRPRKRSEALDAQSVSAHQLAPQDLSLLAVLSTAAAQQEDLFDCLASISKSSQAKTERLQTACKNAVSAFKSQQSREIPNTAEYLRAARVVAWALQTALNSRDASSCGADVILGKDEPADVREESDQSTQELCRFQPVGF